MEQQIQSMLDARQQRIANEELEKRKTDLMMAKLRSRKRPEIAAIRDKLAKPGVMMPTVTHAPTDQRDTISMGYDRFLKDLPADTWKLLPHTYGPIITDGAWKPYNYLIMLSTLIATAIARGNGRIIISTPPRHGKSFFTSYILPAWFLTNWPDQRVILTSYEANFAASWGRRTRNLIREKGWMTGTYLADDSTAVNNWATSKGGGMMTSGIGGPITGKGFNLGILDDPHKNWQEAQSPTIRNMGHDWFDSTFYTRAEPGATIIINMTRWNEDDMVGRLLTQKRADGWFYIRLPAIAEKGDVLGRAEGEALCPERYDVPALSRIRSSMSILMWNALFQQRPAPMEGTLFLRKNWKRYRIAPQCDFILQSWDTASKLSKKRNGAGDTAFTVCQTWGVSSAGAVLLDRFRDRVEFPQLVRQARVEYMRWRPNVVLIEDRDSGQALIQTLQQDTKLTMPILAVTPDMSKEIRAEAVSPWHEAGRVWIPEDDPETLWAAEIVETAATFPNCAFMDDIDAMSQALAYIMTMDLGGGFLTAGRRRTSALLEGYRQLM